MKQSPSNLKFKKFHKPNSSFLFLNDNKTFYPLHGQFAIKSLEAGKLTFKQIEAVRRSLSRRLDKNSKLWIRVFTYASLSKKPIASRMGKGKGNHAVWVCPIRKGQILYEIGGLSEFFSLHILKCASSKLPIKTVLVKNFF